MERSLRVLACLTLLSALMLPVAAGACSSGAAAAPTPAGRVPLADLAGLFAASATFTDVAGLMNASAPGYGTGTAWGDYDGDGDLDLYVVNLGAPPGIGEPNVLLRNDGSTFTDVTVGAGVGDDGPGVAAVWGDIDNDGDLDLFVSNRPGSNALYRNEGNGTFIDVAAEAGVTDPAGYGEGAAWIDFDHDSLLDLYVANYSSQGGIPNRLFRNLDGLHFTDVAGPLGVADMGNGEGIAWADFDNDGDQDLYIANANYSANALYRQQADGTFVNVAAAMHVLGGPGRSFGAAWGDYDNDGWLDLYVAQEGANKLYRNLGGADFADVTAQAGVGGDRWSLGCAWGDYDNDGYLDLHVANAAVTGYDPADVLYRNEGGAPVTFSDVTAAAGVTNTLDARGSAWGDFDGDGDLDLYVVDQGSGQPNRLFRNEGSASHWLHVRPIGSVSNRAAVGARVAVTSDHTQIREISGGSGFASQDSLAAEFGLGGWSDPVTVSVRWPSGIQVLSGGVALDQAIALIEPAPDLSAAAKAVSTSAAVPGAAVTYTVALPNSGDWPAPAQVTDTLPLSLTWGGYVTATAGTPTWDEPARRLLWSGTVSPAMAVTITYRVTVNPGLAPGLAITNAATVDDGYRSPWATAPVTLTTLCQELAQVALAYTPTLPLTGRPVTFSAAATGSLPIAFDWSFDDGGTAGGAVVSHTFALDGLHAVTLTAANACGQAVVTAAVDVCAAVRGSAFGWTPLLPIVGQPFTLTASAAGRPPISFGWDLGDGTAASGITVTHVYTQAGSYRVTLTATNECGQETISRTVAACAAVQQTGFSWTPLTPTAGLAVTFTASASGTAPITFTWDWGDGITGSGAIASHTYTETGAYTVSLVAANACGQELVARVLVVRPSGYRIYLPVVLRDSQE